ncbi:hypothetical protein C8R45DRAFT_1080788 [Mycena sanguinolenta]|nr:hypothetical protein C8R45DRAFT_1080788 [Mycena sanguinolenta]
MLMMKLTALSDKPDARVKIIKSARMVRLLEIDAVVRVEHEVGGSHFEPKGNVVPATSGYATDCSPTGLLARHRPELLTLATTNGEHATDDGLHLALGISTPAAVCGCMFFVDPDAKTKFLATKTNVFLACAGPILNAFLARHGAAGHGDGGDAARRGPCTASTGERAEEVVKEASLLSKNRMRQYLMGRTGMHSGQVCKYALFIVYIHSILPFHIAIAIPVILVFLLATFQWPPPSPSSMWHNLVAAHNDRASGESLVSDSHFWVSSRNSLRSGPLYTWGLSTRVGTGYTDLSRSLWLPMGPSWGQNQGGPMYTNFPQGRPRLDMAKPRQFRAGYINTELNSSTEGWARAGTRNDVIVIASNNCAKATFTFPPTIGA